MAEDNARDLLNHWRIMGWPVFHVRHISVEPGSPLGPDTGGADFMDALAPTGDELVFEKSVNSAFIGTNLEQTLRDHGMTELVICGLTTPHCVSTSTRMAANLGFQTILAHDACAAFTQNAQTSWKDDLAPMHAQDIHDTAISQLHGEFCTARGTAEILSR